MFHKVTKAVDMKIHQYLVIKHTGVVQLVKPASKFLLLLFKILIIAICRVGQGWQEAPRGLAQKDPTREKNWVKYRTKNSSSSNLLKT